MRINVPRSQEILDSAFKRASAVYHREGYKRAMAKIDSACDAIATRLTKCMKAFPSFTSVPDFYRELYSLYFDIDQARKSLYSLKWCAGQVRKIGTSYVKAIRARRKPPREAVTECFGRISSVVKDIDSSLEYLQMVAASLKQIPTIDLELPTVVVAGMPNVGKSRLVRSMSTARPKVAGYPFTTKEMSLGVFTIRRRRVQILDTPGLLDRPWDRRSQIEKHAVLALSYLADTIIYLIDSALGECEEQMSLLRKIKEAFPAPVVEVESKCDIVRLPTQRHKISAVTGEGIEELKELAGQSAIKNMGKRMEGLRRI